MNRTIIKEVRASGTWKEITKEFNRIGAVGAKKITKIEITPYHSKGDPSYTIRIHTKEDRYE